MVVIHGQPRQPDSQHGIENYERLLNLAGSTLVIACAHTNSTAVDVSLVASGDMVN